MIRIWRCHVAILLAPISISGTPTAPVLDRHILHEYVAGFNKHDSELYANAFPNGKALEFLARNIPLFDCPDEGIRQTYYFRWWTFRKHLRATPDGWVITEFLPQVPWSGKHNTISCPAGHHFYEGRWLHNPEYIEDYARFWFRKGDEPRRYSFWAADSIYAQYLAHKNITLTTNLLDDLLQNYQEWEKSHQLSDGLFWQIDDRDGMEVSVGGSGRRATINSYMYGDAVAISKIATIAKRSDIARLYNDKANTLRDLVQRKLWNTEAGFFTTMPGNKHNQQEKPLVAVRELHGFTPWYFNLPAPGYGYEHAWKQLMDPEGFYAPFGPTTTERRHREFAIHYQNHECQWNGPSWPFSTSMTLTGLANLLNGPQQAAITKADYYKLLTIYTNSHRLKREDETVVPWIDENLNPLTGDWIARTRLKNWKNNTWDEAKGGKERGKDYNHSSYCDLIITGLVGLRPRSDDTIEVNPLVPENTWDFFCLEHVRYHGKKVTIIWDKNGKKYHRGAGLRIIVDGKTIAHSPALSRITGKLIHTEEH